jgi:20S proteasome subunit beta 2
MAELTSSTPLNLKDELSSRPRGGFSFDLFDRDAKLGKTMACGGVKMPSAMKTGTTIVGIIFAGGVCLGADTRATNDTEVADKNCEKIHYLADNIYCCGAGTAADTEKTTEMIASQLELHRLNTGAQPRVVTALTLLKRMLYKYQGHVSAALVLGGCDLNGPHLYDVYPHGSTSKLPYVTMGSGSLAAMSVFETGWKEGMDEAEAISLVKDAIHAGIFNDLGSGSNVDITIIPLAGPTKILRGYDTPNEQADLRGNYERPKSIVVAKGATAVLETHETRFEPLASRVTMEVVDGPGGI